ncbi:MAG: glycosyltransferase [Fibrobacteraceae bacterium]|nr:glycosyltransferase [Fibrobacteraceae bacterium]
MNLLFLYRIYPNFGGVETVTTVLANRFVKDGHQVTIVSIEQPHMELMEQLDSNIKLFKLEYPVNCAGNISKLHEIVVNRKIDCIVNQWGLPFKTTKLCNAAIRGTSCHVISVLHGSPYTSKIIISAQDKVKNARNFLTKAFMWLVLKAKESIIKWSIRYNIAHNDRYILLSNGFIKPLVDYSKTKKTDNIIAIGNPITIPVNLEGFSLSDKKKQILYAGRMDFENKRVNRILYAWHSIADEYPDWNLVLVGDGPHKPDLLKMIEMDNIPRVSFFGFQKEPPINFYKDASIYMLTSDLEGFGLVIIESMSYGVVPIVYGSYEAVYDIIENGKSGFITPQPYSNKITVNCLRKLMDDEKLRKMMALNAMEKAQTFALNEVTKQWYSVLQEIIISKRN